MTVRTHLIGWLLLPSICLSSAQNEAIRYPTVLYSEKVKFEDIPGAQQSVGQGYPVLVFKGDFSELYAGGQDVLKVVDTSTFDITGELRFSTNSLCPGDESQCPHVSIVEQLTETCLFVCITTTPDPECYFVDVENQPTKAASDFNVDSGEAVPTDSTQKTTWMYVPGESRLFTAVGTQTNQAESYFRFSNLIGCSNGSTDATVKADGSDDWLNRAEFIGKPYLYNGFLYFTYHEYSTEDINAADRIVYSRIARVCQNDTGGEQFTNLAGEFTTFQKARLDCTLKEGDDVRFEYNVIQGTYKIDKTLFAVFTTPMSSEASSAVCAYNVDEIEQLFDQGQLRGQEANGKLWTPLEDADKPADFDKLFKCGELPLSLSPAQITILQTYPLMNRNVPNKFNYEDESGNDYRRPSDAPIFVHHGVRFTQIVVDDVIDPDVMFLGTERGTVIKAYLENSEAYLVEEIDLNIGSSAPAPILRMVRNPGGPSESPVFASTGNGLYRVPVQHCSNKTFLECVKDPYCGCTSAGDECVTRTAGGTPEMCNNMPDTTPAPCTILGTRSGCSDPAQPDLLPRDKSANLNFAARAPEGAGLASSPVTCECVDGSPAVNETVVQGSFTAVHYLTVSAVVGPVTSECTCSVTFTTSCDEQRLDATISVDAETVIDEPSCKSDVVKYDRDVSAYRFLLRKWKLENQITSCPAGK